MNNTLAQDKCKNREYCEEYCEKDMLRDEIFRLIMMIDCRTCTGWSGRFCLHAACNDASLYKQRAQIQAWVTTSSTPNAKIRG